MEVGTGTNPTDDWTDVNSQINPPSTKWSTAETMSPWAKDFPLPKPTPAAPTPGPEMPAPMQQQPAPAETTSPLAMAMPLPKPAPAPRLHLDQSIAPTVPE